jgi:hypothetical protein
MSDYTTKFNVVFFNAMLNASEKFNFFMDGAFTKSEGSYSSFGVLESTIPDGTNHDLDYSMVNEYSDLDYSLFELTYGVSFQVDTNARLYGSITYMELTDDQPYVYGDQDGNLNFYSAGMTVGF